MRSCSYIICFALITFLAISCNNKIYFSNDMRIELENNRIDLMKLQYYIDKDVILTREISSVDAKITRGSVVFQNGRYFKNVLLRRFTKGACIGVYQKRMDIAFELGDNKNIIFSIPKLNNKNNVYTLTNEGAFSNISNFITYDGKQYQLSFKGNSPKLMINGRVVEKVKMEDRIMKGLRVS